MWECWFAILMFVDPLSPSVLNFSIRLLTFCGAAMEIWTWEETEMRGLSEQERNGNKWLENNGWECMQSPKKPVQNTVFNMRNGLMAPASASNGSHALWACSSLSDAICALQTVPFIGHNSLARPHLLSLFLLNIQIHTDLRILLSFVTVTQELIESYLSEIYSFCTSRSFSLSDPSSGVTRRTQITVCTQLTGFILIHACAGITHSNKKVKMFHSNTVIQPCSRLNNQPQKVTHSSLEKASRSLIIFGFHAATAFFKSHQIFSKRFKSGEWTGHSRTSCDWSLNQA